MEKKIKKTIALNVLNKDKIDNGSSFFKQFLLSILSIFILIIISTMPKHKIWLNNQLKTYYKDYKNQKKNMDLTKRWEERHGYEYMIPVFIKNNININKDIVLLPPLSFLKKVGFPINWTDDRWFYYMTESKIKRITWDSITQFKNATVALTFSQNGQMQMTPLNNEQNKLFVTSQYSYK